jgi:uncharacterized protein
MTRKVALITGASAGLGEQFAQLFARDGHDVILVARNAARLEALASKLEQEHKVKAHVLAADLARPEEPQRIFNEVRSRQLEVEFLVNNAGFGTSGIFLDQEVTREAEIVEVNCTALLKLTHLFARPMRERRSGRILNVASTAAFQPGPFMTTYYATKAFVLHFSEALSHELKGTGVTVTCHCPGPTHTEFALRAGNEKSRLFKQGVIATASDAAADAYAAMMKGRVLAIHGFLNWFGVMVVRLSPRAMVRSIAGRLNQP